MKRETVLVTNDDGIDSFFLRTLVSALKERFEVYVAAPLGEQSWVGRAISRGKSISMAHYDDELGCQAWALDGTPSDCVNIAMAHLMEDKPDVVVSGINIAHNVSTPLVFSSGTVAGAIEGVCWGVRSIAFSQFVSKEDRPALRLNHGRAEGELLESLKNGAQRAVEITEEVLKMEYEPYVLRNVNFPMGTNAETEIEETRPAPLSIGSIYKRDSASSFSFSYPEEEVFETAEGTDLHCILDGKISISEIDLKALGGVRAVLS